MDFLELLSIILPALATLGIFCVIVINLYKKIRMKFPVNVNCWFCNEWTSVEYDLQNSWDCPKCEQYNGFSLDGDYNKTISAQYDEFLNTPVSTKTKNLTTPKNGLCDVCNNNQRLKIHQLAVFSPIDEAYFDEEIERYQQQLERAYPLCPSCEQTVKETLRKQKSMLLGFKLSNLRKHGSFLLNLSSTDDFHTAKKVHITNLLKILILILTITQLINTAIKINIIQSYKLPKNTNSTITFLVNIFGAITKLIYTFSEYFSYLYSFTVVDISLLVYLQKSIFDFSIFYNFINVYVLKIFNLEKNIAISVLGAILEISLIFMKNNTTNIDYLRFFAWNFNILSSLIQVYQIFNSTQVFVFLQILTCVFLVVFKSPKNLPKIEKQSFSINSTITSTPEKKTKMPSPCQEKHEEANIFKCADSTLNPTLNLSGLLPTFDNFSVISPETTPIFGQKPVFENPLNFKYRNNLNDSFSDKKSVFNESLNLNESLSSNGSVNFNGDLNLDLSLNEGLNKLHLSTYRKEINPNEIPSAFRISNLSRPKPVLSPPKLGNFTQSSWLAGGYWKNGDYTSNYSNLSRSSSQSSGFGSQTSSQNLDIFNSLPSSRNNSVCGEFDKFSVFSEPAYHIYPQNKYKNNDNFYAPQKITNLSSSHNNLNLQSNKYFVPISRNSNFSSRNQNFLPISTQNIVKPTLNTTNDNFWTADNNLRPNSTNSHNSNIYLPRNNFVVSSVIYKPNNDYVKGSLLKKWREQNCADDN